MRTKHEQESVPQILSPRKRFRYRFLVLQSRRGTTPNSQEGEETEQGKEEQGSLALPTSWQVSGEDAHARTWSIAVL